MLGFVYQVPIPIHLTKMPTRRRRRIPSIENAESGRWRPRSICRCEPKWACSSAWLERTPDKREVGSSSLPRPTIFAANNLDEPHQNGGVAQLGERLLCKQEVIGSIPFTSTIFLGLVVKKKFGIGI